MKQVQEAHEAKLKRAWQAHEEELERTRVAHENSEQELTQKVSQLEGRVTEERERYKALWHLNCMQLAEYDEMITCKEEEIQTLKEKINALEAHLGSPLLLETGHEGYVNMSAPSHTECTMKGVSREAVVPVSHLGCSPAHTPPVASQSETMNSNMAMTRYRAPNQGLISHLAGQGIKRKVQGLVMLLCQTKRNSPPILPKPPMSSTKPLCRWSASALYQHFGFLSTNLYWPLLVLTPLLFLNQNVCYYSVGKTQK